MDGPIQALQGCTCGRVLNSRAGVPAVLRDSAFGLARQGAHKFANDSQHDFIGTAADRHQTNITECTGCRVVPHEAVAPPVLQAAVGHFTAQAAGLQLGHGGEFGYFFAFNVQLAGFVRQGAQGLYFCLQLGQAEVNNLVVDQWRSEGFALDRKSTRLNSSHVRISYAVFCLKKKKKKKKIYPQIKKKKTKLNKKSNIDCITRTLQALYHSH